MHDDRLSRPFRTPGESTSTQNIICDLFSITGKKRPDVGHLASWETTTAN